MGRSGILAAVATVLVAGLSQGASVALAAAGPCALGVSAPATYSHVVVIMEENASYGKVIGSAKAPYFNQLATQCALATNYHDDASVSQPNYMAATGGFATGVGVHDKTASIFDQSPSWIELEESMTSNCGGSGTTFYKHGHDPAYWYTPLATACTLYDVGMAASDTGATGLPNPPPAYTWITPNLCHDDHWQTGCSGTSKQALSAMDTWLSGTVQQITATLDYQAGNTLILVTFDESSSSTTTKVATVAVAGGIAQPIQDHTFYDHYALLRASEEALGVTPFLGNAATANNMRTGMGF